MIFEAGVWVGEGGIHLLVILQLMLEQNENPSDPGGRDNSEIFTNLYTQKTGYSIQLFHGCLVNSQNYSPEVPRTARCTIARGRPRAIVHRDFRGTVGLWV